MPVEKVSAHYLAPKHEIVPSEKVDEFLRKFGVEREAMPKILEKDPAAAEIGAKKGDIIKITRLQILPFSSNSIIAKIR